ncbi:hypothetical protein RhiirA5_506236 [Rhizophagus irregularis]|uniref:Uncharacterized protein n=2 Tax=Rhizophagus irregularis TaxID=588596 RepID=A0A2N0NUP3_9GLOM|nr:hypothetical protein GLOIN_2v1768043 [Rhizophagus irregularis DAOM 181602=DAOM 197198]PKB98294.1 hypothetical protein RhiirA5_506236 [Rhizophagus irregularis]POG77249.1 hypothetical protein GLOIN_2v1768043 [Rhizophagus irregularis DAOM 181602=DAOM 197198]GBC45216.1 hypothetical protein GLOIN_2v1768043 [Rhizophagus irregularis DAOM 181602=DAOM 197198]|eukprot:XP_025184115.1 hypothetical protein GLOIN_2v1768043 [Rhizophagus irregularis DAOM 181602=DAOM 197198]
MKMLELQQLKEEQDLLESQSQSVTLIYLIPDPQFPLHNNIHSLIRQQIQQLIQLPVYQQNTANNIQQQLNETIQPTTQVYSNNNTYDTTSISVNGTISYNIQDEEFQNSP